MRQYKSANDLLQPPTPPPPVSTMPKPPGLLDPQNNIAPAPRPPVKATSFGMPDVSKWMNPGKLLNDGMSHLQKMTPPGFDQVAAATQNRPPLTMYTNRLPESIRGPVDSVLGFAQKGLQSMGDKSPQMVAGLMGGLAPELTKGLLSTPAGLPALVGMHGLLRGGESAAAAKTLFNPLLSKIGI